MSLCVYDRGVLCICVCCVLLCMYLEHDTIPVVSDIQILPIYSTYGIGDILECSYHYDDDDGDVENGTDIRWFHNTLGVNGSLEFLNVFQSKFLITRQIVATV